MSEDQFIEIVADAIARHVSRDRSIAEKDQQWEDRQTAASIANSLRIEGIPFIPEVDRKS